MDRSVVIRAQAGEHEAFAAIAAASLGSLNATARLILRDHAAADDAVQDALVDAWRGIRGLNDPDRLRPWLHRLLVRACFDQARRRSRRYVVETRAAAPQQDRSADGAAGLADRDLLERALAQLPVDQRAAVVLVYYVDLPLAEAATALGIPLGTMKSRLHRSLAKLRTVIDVADRPETSAEESIA